MNSPIDRTDPSGLFLISDPATATATSVCSAPAAVVAGEAAGIVLGLYKCAELSCEYECRSGGYACNSRAIKKASTCATRAILKGDIEKGNLQELDACILRNKMWFDTKCAGAQCACMAGFPWCSYTQPALPCQKCSGKKKKKCDCICIALDGRGHEHGPYPQSGDWTKRDCERIPQTERGKQLINYIRCKCRE
jgi:hypothetical protein